MDNRPAPLRWTHWTRFLLIPVCFLLLVGALVQQGQSASAPSTQPVGSATPPSGPAQELLATNN